MTNVTCLGKAWFCIPSFFVKKIILFWEATSQFDHTILSNTKKSLTYTRLRLLLQADLKIFEKRLKMWRQTLHSNLFLGFVVLRIRLKQANHDNPNS